MPSLSSLVGSGVKSIQRGQIGLATTVGGATATISSVNTSKTELRKLGAYCAIDDGSVNITLSLTNGTTITASRSIVTNSATVSWELTEYY